MHLRLVGWRQGKDIATGDGKDACTVWVAAVAALRSVNLYIAVLSFLEEGRAGRVGGSHCVWKGQSGLMTG